MILDMELDALKKEGARGRTKPTPPSAPSVTSSPAPVTVFFFSSPGFHRRGTGFFPVPPSRCALGTAQDPSLLSTGG